MGELRRAAILISAFSTRGQMALSSHMSNLTRHPVQQVGRGLLSQRRVGRPRCSGENTDRAAGHTSLKRWLLSSSQGTVEVGAGFKNTGGNIDTALGRSGLRRRFVRYS